MPHPYHGAGPAQFGIILGPVLFVAAFWKRRRGWVFWCLAACLALFAVVLVLMRPGVTGVNTDPIMGLLQRILALAGFAPLGLAAYDLLKQQMQGTRLSLDFRNRQKAENLQDSRRCAQVPANAQAGQVCSRDH